MIRQAAAYSLVGCAALATHLVALAGLVEVLQVSILLANVFAFAAAFFVSFWGHSRWTFEIQREAKSSARRKFFAVAAVGFILNQAVYAEVLRVTGGLYYLPVLAVILLATAAVTFALSKFWAFAHPPHAGEAHSPRPITESYWR